MSTLPSVYPFFSICCTYPSFIVFFRLDQIRLHVNPLVRFSLLGPSLRHTRSLFHLPFDRTLTSRWSSRYSPSTTTLAGPGVAGDSLPLLPYYLLVSWSCERNVLSLDFVLLFVHLKQRSQSLIVPRCFTSP